MPKLSDVPTLPLALNRAEWEMLTPSTRQTYNTMFLAKAAIDAFDNSEDYKAKMTMPNSPIIEVPANRSIPYQPFRARYSNVPGYAAGIALDSAGNPKTITILPRTDGAANMGSVETQVQPGGTDSPTLTLLALGGAQAANFFAEYGGYFPGGTIPAIGWLPYTPDTLMYANFDGVAFNQIPLAWSSMNSPGNMDWMREWCPAPGSMFGSPFRVVLFRFADFTRLIPKFGQQGSSAPAPVVYANDGAKTAAVIVALEAAGLSGAVLGDAVNAAARKVL